MAADDCDCGKEQETHSGDDGGGVVSGESPTTTGRKHGHFVIDFNQKFN